MEGLQKYSLLFDFIEEFKSLIYKGFPLAFFLNFSHFTNIVKNEGLINTEVKEFYKNKTLNRKELQPTFDKLVAPFIKPTFKENSDGKILLYDECNLRFTENIYLEYFNSDTTVIVRGKSENKELLGLPIHCLEKYMDETEEVKKEFMEKAKKIFLSNQNHAIFKIPAVQKRFYLQINFIIDWLTATINYFAQEVISCVIVGGVADHISRMLILVASSKGIPSICLQHGIIAEDRGWLPILASKEAVYSLYEKEFYKNAGVEEERIEVIGHPKYDQIFTKTYMSKKDFCEKLDISPDKKKLLFATQPYKLKINFLEQLIKNLIRYDFEIIIKPHPSEIRTGLYKSYEKLSRKYKQVKLVLSTIDLYDIIANVDIVCVYFSTVGLESALFGKSVIYLTKENHDGANYDYVQDLSSIPLNPYILARLIVKRVANNISNPLIKHERENFISTVYPQKLSGKKLSDLIYQLSGVTSYKLPSEIVEGMVLKGQDEKIYIIEKGMKRQIPSLHEFEKLGLKWEIVQTIDEKVLRKVPSGSIKNS